MKKLFPSFVLLFMASMFSSCGSTSTISMDTLSASAWELEYITGTRIAFEGLFPEKKPTLDFRLGKGVLGGNTGCNGFSTSVLINGDKIKIDENHPMTMRYCEGGGEQQFLKMLYKADQFKIDEDGKLVLLMNGIESMRFHKIND